MRNTDIICDKVVANSEVRTFKENDTIIKCGGEIGLYILLHGNVITNIDDLVVNNKIEEEGILHIIIVTIVAPVTPKTPKTPLNDENFNIDTHRDPDEYYEEEEYAKVAVALRNYGFESINYLC